jgi:anaerobic magnesium-protoporphyrin IX monomethyl ester cyclase
LGNRYGQMEGPGFPQRNTREVPSFPQSLCTLSREHGRMVTNQRDSVCLIIPPSVFLLDERVFPSLGILKVASVLEQAGCALSVLDLSGIKNYRAALTDYLTASDDAVFAITATTPQMPQVTEVRRIIRAHRPAARTILGGPHVTLTHTAAKKELRRQTDGRASKALRALHADFDVLVSGDGEKAIFEALSDYPPKLIDANELHSPLFVTREEFDASPFPARHLIDLSSYRYSIDNEPSTSLIGQLGCPFSCGFCGGRESPCLRVVRIRSTASIVDEIASIYEQYGFTGFMFYDDELNVNPRFMELLEGLVNLQIRLGTWFRFRGFVKSELFSERQAKMMYRAGFRWILSGFETGSPRILANINKRATKEDNSRCVAIAHEQGLKVKALMSLGHPGESHATIAETRDWLLQAKPDDVDVTIITPYPGTAYYDRAVQAESGGAWVYTVPSNGDRLYCREIDYHTTAVYYKGDPNDGYRAFTHTDRCSSDDLVRLRGEIEEEVRKKLSIPYYPSRAAQNYDHSMGQTGELPEHILKSSMARIAV